jgi:hypothetical protein
MLFAIILQNDCNWVQFTTQEGEKNFPVLKVQTAKRHFCFVCYKCSFSCRSQLASSSCFSVSSAVYYPRPQWHLHVFRKCFFFHFEKWNIWSNSWLLSNSLRLIIGLIASATQTILEPILLKILLSCLVKFKLRKNIIKIYVLLCYYLIQSICDIVQTYGTLSASYKCNYLRGMTPKRPPDKNFVSNLSNDGRKNVVQDFPV